MTSFKTFCSSLAALAVVAGAPAIPAGVTALAIAAAPGAAHADCRYFVGPEGHGDGVICDPEDPQPKPRRQPVIPHYSVYAVIAGSDRTGYSTMVWRYEQLEQAKTAAIAKCARVAVDCRVREWTPHCVAEADSADHRTWGVAEDWLMDKAAAEAVRQCRIGGGVQCHVTTHHCADDTP